MEGEPTKELEFITEFAFVAVEIASRLSQLPYEFLLAFAWLEKVGSLR